MQPRHQAHHLQPRDQPEHLPDQHSPGDLPVLTRICLILTRGCPIDTGPIRPRPLQPGPGTIGGASDPGAWYGASDPVDDAFWTGYYAALDAVTEAEQEEA